MGQLGTPRIQPVDKDGKLLWKWREEWSRRRTLKGTIWCFVILFFLVGFFVLIREVLPPSIFEPHLDAVGTLGVWIILSIAFTSLTLVLLFRFVNVIRESISAR